MAQGEGPAGVAEQREVSHRLQAVGVDVTHQAGEVPQRVPVPHHALGDGVALVAEFSLLCQVRHPLHLFDILFEPS